MKKITVLSILFMACFVVMADAAPKKIALVGRISWCPDSPGAQNGNRDFDIMPFFSMDDEILRFKLERWGFFAILMPDYVTQSVMNGGDKGNLGYETYINPGDYMFEQNTDPHNFLKDNGFDLVYITGTCWSSTAPPVKNSGVPIIQGEHSCLGQRNKIGSLGMFFGERSNDHSGCDTLVLTDAGKAHPLMSGLPAEIKIFGNGPSPDPPANPGSVWAGISNHIDDAAPGTKVLAVWQDAPEQAAITVVDEGGELADGSKAKARMLMMFWTGSVRPSNGAELPPIWTNVIDYLTDDGKNLNLRCVLWALGEDPTAVNNWQNQ
ncbi:MAG: hypothetical protein AB1656_08735 [Candidatus Omnitrophota bacterium]